MCYIFRCTFTNKQPSTDSSRIFVGHYFVAIATVIRPHVDTIYLVRQ